MVVLSFRNRGE
ncbi:hypothetical protein A2U01_0090934, partial [Trifolium medium]|nr:hypothetical protein [Trifolium medium]